MIQGIWSLYVAVDETEAIQLFYNGRATSAQTPIPPGINGYDPSFKNPYRSGDLEKAKKLLAEAGYPGGKGFPVIPFDNLADSTSRQQAEYLQKQLRNFQAQGGKQPERVNAVMNGMSANLKEDEIKSLAAHYGSQKLKPALARDKSWYVGVEGGAMIVEDINYDIGASRNAATVDHT